MLRRTIRCWFLLLYFIPAVAAAAILEVTLTGLEGEPEKNVLAYLGAAPETEQDRLNFVVSARGKVSDGLKVLGYYQPDIDIEVIRTDPVWQLEITVDQGEPVRIRDVQIQILGEAASDPEFVQLLSDVEIVHGDILHHGQFESFRRRVLALGLQRGYMDGDILESRVAVRVDATAADVVFRYDSGPRFRFGEVTYDHALLEAKLFDRLVTFQPGDYYDQARLKNLQSQLQSTRYFSSVVIQPLTDKAVGHVLPIAVQLQAAKRHTFNVGVGYATDTEGRVSMTWRTPRINRFGHSQVTRFEYSRVAPSGRFTYSIPLSHPLNDLLHLGARGEQNEFGDIDSTQAELSARREMKSNQWVYGYSLRGLTESWEVAQTNNENSYLLPGVSVSSREYAGSVVDPSSGFNQLYTIEAANHQLGSDIDLVRMKADLRYIFSLWQDSRVVTRAELGAVEIASGDRTDLAPSLSFFAGGSHSIRGYSYQSIGHRISVVQADGSYKSIVVGGDRLVTGSVEYQHYLNRNWRGALFVDAGDAFNEGDFDGKVGAGFGVHYITRVGAIRVEVANSLSENDQDWQLHLTIGAEF